MSVDETTQDDADSVRGYWEKEYRRVLAERDDWKAIAGTRLAVGHEQRERAEKAEEELKRLRKLHPSSLDGLAWDAPGMQAPGRPGPDD